MRLSEYLEAKKLKPSRFAEMVGVPASTITRLVRGERSPGIELIEKIVKATDGAITPNDFIAPAPHEVTAAGFLDQINAPEAAE